MVLYTQPAGQKVSTFMIVPSGNATLLKGPSGFTEYVGEDAFDEILVDNTAGRNLTSAPIPDPWSGGGGYNVTLGPGVNAILVPRGIFLNTTLGAALVGNRTFPESSTVNATPLIGRAELDAISNLTGGGSGTDLGLLSWYWQDRTLATFDPGALHGELWNSGKGNQDPFLDGVTQGSNLTVNLYSDNPNATLSNSGGYPTDPEFETIAAAGGSLQYVVTLNITNYTDPYLRTTSAVPGLDLLLAGLLDNTTGGVNGTVLDVSSTLNELGLPLPVIASLPNVTTYPTALFGGPTKANAAPSGFHCSGWVCGVEQILNDPLWWVQGIEYVLTGGWVPGFLETFVALGSALLQFGIDSINCSADPGNCAVTVLTEALKAGQAIENAFASFLITLVKDFLGALFDPIAAPVLELFLGYAGVVVIAGTALLAVSNTSNLRSFFDALGRSVFLIGLTIGVILLVATLFIDGLTLGQGFLVGLVLGFLVNLLESAAIQSLVSGSPLSPSDLGEAADLSGAVTLIQGAFCKIDVSSYQGACTSTTLSGYLSTFGSAFDDVGTYASQSIAAGLISTSIHSPKVASLVAGFAVGLAGLAVAGYAYSHKSWEAAVVGAAISGVGVYIDHLSSPVFSDFEAVAQDIADGLDWAVFFANMAETAAYWVG